MDIAPLNDRLVLFSSMHMPHRVLPSTAERYCFTVWMSQGGARRPHHTSSGGAGGGGSADKEREALRQALARPEPLSEKGWWCAWVPWGQRQGCLHPLPVHPNTPKRSSALHSPLRRPSPALCRHGEGVAPADAPGAEKACHQAPLPAGVCLMVVVHCACRTAALHRPSFPPTPSTHLPLVSLRPARSGSGRCGKATLMGRSCARR